MGIDNYVLMQLNDTLWWDARYSTLFDYQGSRRPLYADMKVRAVKLMGDNV